MTSDLYSEGGRQEETETPPTNKEEEEMEEEVGVELTRKGVECEEGGRGRGRGRRGE